ncbi:3-hydroxyisobutyrate dehydrogenase [Planktotalea arctica]|uniref:3-hydroxyisobutyrate dehydrogenase n=1 Tax=Planktotalea arctica TaxID=1481893 RepID=UPI003219F0A1
MSEIDIRKSGRSGHITLNRPGALNALTYDMVRAIDAALLGWANDSDVALIVIDAMGEKAFCAGGDIADLYESGKAGDFAFGQGFWRDEYRMNARLASYPKPVVSFLQGFTMGGGVGVGCHAAHRIVGQSSRIAMPECGIGLVPDVGGSMLLAHAPGRLGEYLGLCTARMGPGDAILAGFADHFLPEEAWEAVKAALLQSGDLGALKAAVTEPPSAELAQHMAAINASFCGETLGDICTNLRMDSTEFAQKSLAAIERNSPLAMACAVEMIHRLRSVRDLPRALELEYRFTHRAMEHGDFLEGIRALIIDKDRAPKWKHALDKVPAVDVSFMLRPLGKDKLTFEEESTAMQIGFIGLGNMGGPMAANLAAAGHHVRSFDVAGTSAAGAVAVASALEAATNADVVITMLPNGAILRSVADEVIPAMNKGAVLLDCSTVDVESARAVAALCEAAGVLALDAPVSGGTGGASGGTLTFMVGGAEEGFNKALPLFEIMGQKAVHCGAPGNGQAAKICNNMILGVTMIATCEAFALADKLGLDRQKMFDVVSTSSGYSWSMNAYCPAPGVGPTSPADNGYKPGFAADLMLKDLRLAQQAAIGVDADTPMGAMAQALYAQFVEDEDGAGRDFSAMLPRFEKNGRP